MNYFKKNDIKLQLLVLMNLVFISSANNLLDVEDILDDKFMPGSLLLLEGTDTYTNSSVQPETEEQIHDGSIIGAISTMGFHRQKMNEYLCRSYIAGQILSDMSFSRIRRRLGQPYPSMGRTIPLKEQSQIENSDIKEALLADEGSSNYKHWLKKSMTLEDIYRQIKDRETNEKAEDLEPAADTVDNEYDGEVTGYGVPVNHGQDRIKEHKISQGFSGYGQSGMSGYGQGGYGYSGYGHSGGAYDYNPIPHPVQYNTKGQGAGKNKDLILTNLFEIALTAIAFISFGCFILQVIMCITTASNTTTVATINPIMLPMMMPTDLPLEPLEPFEGNFEPVKLRLRRTTRQDPDSNTAMNELSRRVLLSIEAAIVGQEDNANCLRRKLCEDNRYSRDLQDNQKIWIPVWSFGMSWLSGRIGLRIPAPTAMLDSLKASILGLGNANCEVLYSNCSLPTLRENRRKKRSYEEKEQNRK